MARTNSEEAARKAEPRQPGPAGKSRLGQGTLVWIGLAALVVAAFPTFIVLAVGIIPTLVAYLIDRRANKNATRCMAAMNLAGVAPVLMMLWGRGHTMGAALSLLSDVYNWLLMYGAAAGAVGLLWSMERAAATVLKASARQRLGSLQSRQKKLIAEWGDAVAGPRPG